MTHPGQNRNRDDFSDGVKRTVAARVNHRCSRCGAQTSGPQSDPAKALNLGVASHIMAAAPGGPRYDASLTAEERKGHDNAIWLCQNCGKLIDNDEGAFTAPELRRMKLAAESRSLSEVGVPDSARAPGLSHLASEEIELLIAAESRGGEILCVETMQRGMLVIAGGHEFFDAQDPAVAALHLEALSALMRKGLLRRSSDSVYELTGSGFLRARELKQLRESKSEVVSLNTPASIEIRVEFDEDPDKVGLTFINSGPHSVLNLETFPIGYKFQFEPPPVRIANRVQPGGPGFVVADRLEPDEVCTVQARIYTHIFEEMKAEGPTGITLMALVVVFRRDADKKRYVHVEPFYFIGFSKSPVLYLSPVHPGQSMGRIGPPDTEIEMLRLVNETERTLFRAGDA